jgi:DNA mismatch endonuclease (patch repair protein)
MERFSAEQRSSVVSRVHGTDASLEMTVRRFVRGLGYRYRLHVRDVPGKPDHAFPGRRKIIFVHGCFWHGHDCKRGAPQPKDNAEYWLKKISRNKERDARAQEVLSSLGWDILVIWECQLKDLAALSGRLQSFLA